jgi:DNA-binding Lrp family transcriptional regulator
MVFEEKFTDDEILEAVERCVRKAKVPATEVAKELGRGSPRRVKERMQELAMEGFLEGEKVGSFWCFRPKGKSPSSQ